MNRVFWGNILAVVGGYSVFAYLIAMNWDDYGLHMPIIVFIGCLSLFFLLGSILYKKHHLKAIAVGILIPHIIAGVLFVIGTTMYKEWALDWYRPLVPQVYCGIDVTRVLMQKLTMIHEAIPFIIIHMLTIILSYFSFLVAVRWRNSGKQLWMWLYNNLVIWCIQLILFFIFTNIAVRYSGILVDAQMKFYFAILSTPIIFVMYFFVGKWCHSLKNHVLQVTSMLPITVTALTFYFLAEPGLFERYMLPIATTFLGMICQRIGIVTGARAVVISQYGMLATVIMTVIPTLLIVVGKYSSLPEKNQYDKSPRLKLPKLER